MGRPPASLSLTFWQALDSFAPIVVRLSARFVYSHDHPRAISIREIAISSGIPLSRVIQISESFSWDDVTIGEARRFCAACNFDPTNAKHRRRQYDYIQKCQTHPNRPPHFLKVSPFWETEILPLIHRLKSHPTFSESSRKSPSHEARSAA